MICDTHLALIVAATVGGLLLRSATAIAAIATIAAVAALLILVVLLVVVLGLLGCEERQQRSVSCAKSPA